MSPSTPPMTSTNAAADKTTRYHQPPQSHRPPSNTREDCWSAEETHALIEAWGSLHLSLNRGFLRQHHWDEVTAAVNSSVLEHRRRTDVQCKNRIDTLKKKYKIEKAQVVNGGGYVPSWPFFFRLDYLISGEKQASDSAAAVATPSVATPCLRNFPVGRRSAIPKRPARWLTGEDDDEEDDYQRQLSSSGGGDDDGWSRERNVVERKSSGGCGSGGGASSGETGGDDRGMREMVMEKESRGRRIRQREEEEDDDGDRFDSGCRELGEAIRRLGEVYERVESMKQEQLIELEKHRMAFATDLEFQRMKFLMDIQLQLISRIKRCKSSSQSWSEPQFFAFVIMFFHHLTIN